MEEKNSAEESILSYCTKCRLNRDHVVAARDGVTIIKVKCKTCGGTHLFRDPAIARKSRPPRKKSAAVETVAVLGRPACPGRRARSTCTTWHSGTGWAMWCWAAGLLGVGLLSMLLREHFQQVWPATVTLVVGVVLLLVALNRKKTAADQHTFGGKA